MKDEFIYSTENATKYYVYKWDGIFSGKQGERCRFDRGPILFLDIGTFARDLIEENFYEMPKIEEKDIKEYWNSGLKCNKAIEKWLAERYVIIEYGLGEMEDVCNWMFHTRLVECYLALLAEGKERNSNRTDYLFSSKKEVSRSEYYIGKWDGIFSGKPEDQCTVEEGPMGQYAIEKFARDLVDEHFDTMPEIKEEDTGSHRGNRRSHSGIAKWLAERYVIIEYADGEMKGIYNWLFHTLLVKHYLAKQAMRREEINRKNASQAPVVER